MTHLLLTLSVILNIVFVWYIIQLLKRFLTFQEELDNFSETLEEYKDHIDIVNSLERFYGDETSRQIYFATQKLLLRNVKVFNVS